MRPLLYALLLATAAAPAARAADPNKVFRYAIEVAETNLDPQRVSDLYSNIIDSGIYDAPLDYDYLEASYRTSFASLSPDNSSADATGVIAVRRGDRLPGIPRHTLKARAGLTAILSGSLR